MSVEEGTSKIVDTKIVVVTLIEEEMEDTQIEEAIKIGMVTQIAGLILAGSTKVEITLTAEILVTRELLFMMTAVADMPLQLARLMIVVGVQLDIIINHCIGILTS